MRKTIVCLANSKKYGERCIAGVEITGYNGAGYSVVTIGGQPKWIRPVSNREHGEVSAALVEQLEILDIFEIEVTAEIPHGYQSENVLFNESSLKVISSVKRQHDEVERFLTVAPGRLFGNKGKAVHVDMIDQVENSLVLIHPKGVTFSEITYPNGQQQVRCTFELDGIEYNLAVTDVNFLSQFDRRGGSPLYSNNCYLTISLGVEHNDFHSKLVAAVLDFHEPQRISNVAQ